VPVCYGAIDLSRRCLRFRHDSSPPLAPSFIFFAYAALSLLMPFSSMPCFSLSLRVDFRFCACWQFRFDAGDAAAAADYISPLMLLPCWLTPHAAMPMIFFSMLL